MRTNYVLIDYENVQLEALSVLDAEHFKVFVFVGANQTKVSFAAADALQRMGPRAEYIQIAGNGCNALDFHIAFYIGRIAAKEPDAYFHIISKDTGFDPLIAHLKILKISAARAVHVQDIPLVKVATSKSPPEKVARVLEYLQGRGTAKPGTVKTLSSSISALFQKKLPEAELGALLKTLQTKGYISINGAKVTYSLPAAGL